MRVAIVGEAERQFAVQDGRTSFGGAFHQAQNLRRHSPGVAAFALSPRLGAVAAPATPEIEAMRCASGSHRLGNLGQHTIDAESERHFADVIAEHDLPVASGESYAAGDCAFLLGWTVDGAGANRSDRVRRPPWSPSTPTAPSWTSSPTTRANVTRACSWAGDGRARARTASATPWCGRSTDGRAPPPPRSAGRPLSAGVAPAPVPPLAG